MIRNGYFAILLTLLSVGMLRGCRQPCPPCISCSPCEPCTFPPVTCLNTTVSFDRTLWQVVHVIDGDTLQMEQRQPDGWVRKERVRMLSIDTPEKDEPLFTEATEALKEKVRGGEVTIAFKKENEESRDGFGRLLAYVFVDDRNLNIEMVRDGFSRYWTRFGRSRNYHESFVEAQEDGRKAGLGIWAPDYVDPRSKKQDRQKAGRPNR